MFQVFRVVRDKVSGYSFMQLAGSFTNESEAKQKATKLKGLVLRDGQIWYDLRP